MPFTTACPNCSARLQVPDNLAGKRVRCKKCSEPFLVKAQAEDDEDETPAPAKARPRPQDDDERPSKKSRPADDEDEADEEEEDRPAPKKKKKKKKQGVPPLVIGLVLGGVILVGGGIGAFFLLKDDKKPDSELAAAKGKGGETESGPPWVDYADAEAKFRVKFPAQPQVQNQQVGPVTFKAAVLQRGPMSFVATSGAIPPGEQGDPEKVLDRAVEQSRGMIPGGGSITDTKPITHQGKPGRELTLSVQGATGVVRIFYANNRLYNLTVIGQNVTPTTPIVRPFFDSLQID
jgi:predicted Zn finger-like uncharacterized protein